VRASPADLIERRSPARPMAVPGIDSVERQGAPPGWTDRFLDRRRVGDCPGTHVVHDRRCSVCRRQPQTSRSPHRTATRCGSSPGDAFTTTVPRWRPLAVSPPSRSDAIVRANPYDLDRLGVTTGAGSPSDPRRVRWCCGKGGPRRPEGVVSVDFGVPTSAGSVAALHRRRRTRYRDQDESHCDGRGFHPGTRTRDVFSDATVIRCSPTGVGWLCLGPGRRQGTRRLRVLLVSVMLMIWFDGNSSQTCKAGSVPNPARTWGMLQTLADGTSSSQRRPLPDQADRAVFRSRARISRFCRRCSSSRSSRSGGHHPHRGPRLRTPGGDPPESASSWSSRCPRSRFTA